MRLAAPEPVPAQLAFANVWRRDRGLKWRKGVPVLLGLLTCALLVGGYFLAGAGYVKSADAHDAYNVTFTNDQPGDDCPDDRGLVLAIADGERLYCGPIGSRAVESEAPPRVFEGFSEDEFADVLSLSDSLADGDSLSSGDQDEIRDRIDDIVSTIPEDERYSDVGAGAGWQIWGGVGLLVAGAAGAVLFWRWYI